MRTSFLSRSALFTAWACSFALSTTTTTTHACGPWLPSRWLDEGGARVIKTPEFYWEFEVKRIAKEFLPAEKRIPAPVLAKPQVAEEETTSDPAAEPNQQEVVHPKFLSDAQQFTAQLDIQDFTEALKAQKLKPANVQLATDSHAKMRELIGKLEDDSAPTPLEEAASEFADYHRGALAYHLAKYPQAREAWTALLARPEAERHFRTVWATFMLGKAALQEGQYAEAITSFQKTRELAAKGFSDSTGLAADSYGWEAKAHLIQEHYPEAAKLYLTQLSLGDLTAVISLKHLVPDWVPPLESDEAEDAPAPTIEPSEQEKAQIEAKHATQQKTRMAQAARDPILRRLTTAHILATETGFWNQEDTGGDTTAGRCHQWLQEIELAKIDKVEDAEQLGWVAYTVGNYDQAAKWLKRSSGETYSALWLKAKLDRRDGKTAEAATAMAKAFALMDPKIELENSLVDSESDLPYRSASGDLGALRLIRNEFATALAIFVEGDLWEDAAYVAERVLTSAELKDWVDQHAPAREVKARANDTEGDPLTPEEIRAQNLDKVRYLLGRRLVREGSYALAAPYLPVSHQPDAWFSTPPTQPQDYQKLANAYRDALTRAQNTKLAKKDRARAYFSAACLARYDGMELMGTEVEPDAFTYGGNYEISDIHAERLAGKMAAPNSEDSDPPKLISLPLPSTPEEQKRLAANRVQPEKRFHYRYVAADLAWKAASLLPDGSDELADVLNAAGNWLKARDETAANRFHAALTARCPQTTIGKAAKAKRWFVDTQGTWLKSEVERRNTALGIKPEEEEKKEQPVTQ